MRHGAAQKIGIYLLCIPVALFFLGPIVWFTALALRPAGAAFPDPPSLVFKPTLEILSYIFIDPGSNARQLLNSIIISTGAALLSLPFSIAAAYALSRYRLRAKKFIMLWYLGILMAPPIVFLIPYFILMVQIGWAGTYQGVIVVLQTVTIPFNIWLLKSFFDDVPPELEEAALVDGAGWWQSLLRITLPLAVPGIVVTGMFAFVFSWNNVVFPLVLGLRTAKTLPAGTLDYFGTSGIVWNQMGATAVVAMIPPMIIFLVLGRYIVRGLTFGAVKG
jgi:multiple sugar transport system permease protein